MRYGSTRARCARSPAAAPARSSHLASSMAARCSTHRPRRGSPRSSGIIRIVDALRPERTGCDRRLVDDARWTRRSATACPNRSAHRHRRPGETRGERGRCCWTLDRTDAEDVPDLRRRRDLRDDCGAPSRRVRRAGARQSAAIVDAHSGAAREQRPLARLLPAYAAYALTGQHGAHASCRPKRCSCALDTGGRASAEEQAELQALADVDGITLAAWDWRFLCRARAA